MKRMGEGKWGCIQMHQLCCKNKGLWIQAIKVGKFIEGCFVVCKASCIVLRTAVQSGTRHVSLLLDVGYMYRVAAFMSVGSWADFCSGLFWYQFLFSDEMMTIVLRHHYCWCNGCQFAARRVCLTTTVNLGVGLKFCSGLSLDIHLCNTQVMTSVQRLRAGEQQGK